MRWPHDPSQEINERKSLPNKNQQLKIGPHVASLSDVRGAGLKHRIQLNQLSALTRRRHSRVF